MDKDVIVTVSGMLFAPGKDGEAENIEVISPGEYYYRNGKHYIKYEEVNDELEQSVQNLLKISPDQISIRKRGMINSEMVFDRGVCTASHYVTPYGSMLMEIHTKEMKIFEEEKKIRIRVEYELDINYEHSSDCSIAIDIQSRQEQFRIS